MSIQAPSPTKSDDSPTKDKIFDPSIDMLINDFDDERTLEEEEILAAGESQDPSEELSSLEKEGNMPLEQLLALYGYTGGNGDALQEEEDNEDEPEPEEAMEVAQDEPSPSQKPSKLSAIYDPIPETENEDMKVTETVSRLSDEEEDLANYSSDEEMKKLRKTIMVGRDYQAKVPKSPTKDDLTPSYENADKLMWNPNNTSTKLIEKYLMQAQGILKTNPSKLRDKARLPNGIYLGDNEKALLILQQCSYDTEEALKRLRIDVQLESPSKQNETEWSDPECKKFEEGIKIHGKNFLLIQKEFVKTRSVSELVQFYYMWKKTERHDMFATNVKTDKKKYNLNPGAAVSIDRLLEETSKIVKNASPTQAVSEKQEKSLPNT